MLLLAAAAAVLWQAGIMDDMVRCRTVRAGAIGPEARWETDGKGRLWVSTTPQASGRIELQCRIPVQPGMNLSLEMAAATVSFAGAQSRNNGSGLIVAAPGVHWELLRVTGEGWAEAKGRRVPIAPHDRNVLITITAVDESALDPMRIDIRGLRLIVTHAPR